MSTPAKLNDMYFWDCVVLQIEDEIFSVPKKEFAECSEVFSGMFDLPSGPDAPLEGRVKEHPIVLPVDKKDFIALMKVMYPIPEMSKAADETTTLAVNVQLSKEEWLSVLRLSNMWEMEKYRNYAIERFSAECQPTAVEKVKLGRDFRISQWFIDGLEQLSNPKHQTPNLEVLAPLGWETAARILSLKDRRSCNAAGTNDLGYTVSSIRCNPNESHPAILGLICPRCGLQCSGDMVLPTPALFPPVQGVPGQRIPIQVDGGISCPRCKSGLLSGGLGVQCGGVGCPRTIWSHSSVFVELEKVPSARNLIADMFQEDIALFNLHGLRVSD